jgi:hypothetical protein
VDEAVALVFDTSRADELKSLLASLVRPVNC